MDDVKKNSVLIVDDEKSNLEVLISILSPEYTVYMTKSGLSAVEMANKYLPALILLDILMPDMNGFDVLSVLKKTDKTRHIPVIFITGLDTVEDEEKGLDLDAADFIHKPFSTKIVKSRVRNQIQIVNQIRAIEQYAHNTQVTLTELVKLQQDLEAAVNAAESASHSKSTFLTTMSHELRTPLNVIIGLTGLMLEEDDLTSFIRSSLMSISNAGGTLLSIVNDILDISKIESGKLTLIPVEYQMPSLLNDTITLLKIYIGEKPIEFKLHISGDLPAMLYGDELRVRQIMNNLLSNAMKYTNEGTVELSVECERDGDDVWMEISVKDTGKGIREEDLKIIFSDYFQADTRTNRKTEGTGLGLSITRRLAQMMDGDISVESEYGKGSTFRARLRQGFVSDTKIGTAIAENLRSFSFGEARSQASNTLVRADLKGARVLVVDDMQNNLDVATGLLRKYNMKVDGLTSGQEVVDRIRNEKPHYNAIFMDHMMPGMDGIETVKAIRALETEYARNLPIIALTANAISGAEKMFFENGFQDFLSKPIDIMRMDTVLKKWVRSQIAIESVDESELDEPDPSFEEFDVSIDIPGIDVQKGLSLYGDEMDTYLSILRSFAANTPVVLGRLRETVKETLPDGVISAHGLKGSCASICADQLRAMAAEMESSARKGDFDRFLTFLDSCLKDVEQLVNDINAWFDAYDARRENPRRYAPDSETLAHLKRCCQSYDMSGIDEAMEELESFSYETDADLVAWLREKIDKMELDEVVERLSEEN